MTPPAAPGALLLSFANICKRKGINYQEKVLFVAQDIDYTVGLMCYIQLSLMAAPDMLLSATHLSTPAPPTIKKVCCPQATQNGSGSRRCSPMASGTDAAWRHRWIC